MPTTVVKYVWAKAGTITMPGAAGPVSIPAWGYAMDSCPCMTPGPILHVTQGDTLQVTLHNLLPEPVSMTFPGQETVPHPQRDPGGRFVSYTDHAMPDGQVTYAFVAARPGTYRYESGTHPETQVQMGLYGVLIVRPMGYDPADPGTWTAYGPGTGSGYDVEQVLVTGEVDSRLRAQVAAGSPASMLEYAPDWWTLNGRAFPHTLQPDDASSQPLGARITARVGQRVLLRCVNAGSQEHTLHLGGLTARVIAEDAWPLTTTAVDASYEKHTLALEPGRVVDAIVTPTTPGEFYLVDRDLYHAVNEGQFPGGIMTVLEVAT